MPRSEAMRARSTSSRAAISASCSACVRATSNCSTARRRSSRARSSDCSRTTSVRLDLLGGDDIGLLHAPIGVGALGELGGDLDRAVLLGDLETLRRSTSSTSRVFDDSIRSRSSASSVAIRAVSIASRRLISASSIASSRAMSRALRVLVGGDALGGKPLFLRDAA